MGHKLNGSQAAMQFFGGYVLEKSISIGHLFALALIFSHFQIPLKYQAQVLFWTIAGAVLLRAVMVAVGIELFQHVDWINYLFGAILLATVVRMLIERHGNLQPARNLIIRLLTRYFKISPSIQGNKLLIRTASGLALSPLLLALLMIESRGLLLALDSIPAVLSMTRDPLLVFSSTMFALMGMRTLYFVLISVVERLRYFKMSLVALLIFIMIKMFLYNHYVLPIEISLLLIVGILSAGVLASIFGKPDNHTASAPISDELGQLALVGYRSIRRLIILIIGVSVILVGVVMIVTPGPAFVVIPAGLAILATEFIWARRLLIKLKTKIKDYSQSITNRKKQP